MRVEINVKGIKSEEAILVQSVAIEKYPWPIQSDSVDEIHVMYMLQAVRSLENFLGEIHRIAKAESMVQFIAPYYSSLRASADPRNIRLINEYTIMYFDNEFRKQNDLPLLPFSFKGINAGFQWTSEFATKSEEAQEHAKKHCLNVIDDIMVQVSVVKT